MCTIPAPRPANQPMWCGGKTGKEKNENMTIEKKTQTEDTNKGTLTLDAAYAPKTGVVRLLLMMENQYHAIFVVSGEQEYREKQLV